MNLIHLMHYHKTVKHFDHPLLDGVRSYTGAELQSLALAAIDDPSKGDDLAMALRSCLRHMIGRFLGNWPASDPYLDDMVSEGMFAVSKMIPQLSIDMLAGRPVLKVASQRMQDAIEVMLNNMRSIAAPSTSTQCNLLRKGKDPLYLEAVNVVEEDAKTDSGHSYKNDIFDVLEQIEVKDEIDAAILSRDFWGLTEKEIAEALGVGQSTIHRRKHKLYEQYLILVR